MEKKGRVGLRFGSLLVLIVLGSSPKLWAESFSPAASLSEEILSESVPMAFSVAPISERDYDIHWVSSAPDSVQLSWVPGSFTWVRASRYLVLPRARLAIQSNADSLVEFRMAGKRQILAPGVGTFPVSLFQANFAGRHEDSAELVVSRNGRTSTHRLAFRYRPRSEAPIRSLLSRIVIDVSCSSQSLEIEDERALPLDHWVYLGCRMIHSQGDSGIEPQSEVFVAWTGAKGPVSLSGIRGAESGESQTAALTALMSHHAQSIEFHDASGAGFKIRARLPSRLRANFLGLGIGPYAYSLRVPGADTVQEGAALVTVYGSYVLSEGARLVFFDAFPLHKRSYNDFGLYFNNESARALDERIQFNLLLGFHLISFSSPLGLQHRLGAPQGFEMIWRDAFGRRKNLSLGGFFYPPIDGKAYTNSWLRVGTGRFFGELNYLSWTEKSGDGGSASSRSVGLSFGAPIWFL